jgi:hypothetical protein
MVPCWHRPEVVNMFVNHMERTPCDYAELIPYFVLSPEDPDYSKLLDITAGYSRTCTTNAPLGRKKNEGLRMATALQWDYYMDMGSDDIYTTLLFDYLKPFLIAGEPYFGILHTYSYNPYLNEAVYLPNYHIGMNQEVTAQGQGRCIRRDVVERCMPLWDDGAPFGMDGYSNERIESNGYKCKPIDNGREPLVCQVKSNVCLTCWENFEDLSEPANVDWLRRAFLLERESCYDFRDFYDFHTAVLKISNQTQNKEEAFNLMNKAHEVRTGEVRYSSYDSYKVTVSRKFKKQ